MKKLISSLCLAGLSLTLAACNQATPTSTSTQQDQDDAIVGQVTLIVKYPDKTYEQKVGFEQNDTVMDVLDDRLDIEDDNGMVTSIEDVAQDDVTSTYWMYKVNDEMASVGAEELKVKDGDKIEFYMETFD